MKAQKLSIPIIQDILTSTNKKLSMSGIKRNSGLQFWVDNAKRLPIEALLGRQENGPQRANGYSPGIEEETRQLLQNRTRAWQKSIPRCNSHWISCLSAECKSLHPTHALAEVLPIFLFPYFQLMGPSTIPPPTFLHLYIRTPGLPRLLH